MSQTVALSPCQPAGHKMYSNRVEGLTELAWCCSSSLGRLLASTLPFATFSVRNLRFLSSCFPILPLFTLYSLLYQGRGIDRAGGGLLNFCWVCPRLYHAFCHIFHLLRLRFLCHNMFTIVHPSSVFFSLSYSFSLSFHLFIPSSIHRLLSPPLSLRFLSLLLCLLLSTHCLLFYFLQLPSFYMILPSVIFLHTEFHV